MIRRGGYGATTVNEAPAVGPSRSALAPSIAARSCEGYPGPDTCWERDRPRSVRTPELSGHSATALSVQHRDGTKAPTVPRVGMTGCGYERNEEVGRVITQPLGP